MTSYQFVNSLAGAGKTYAACRWAVEMAERGHKIVIAQPSRVLIAQTLDDLKSIANDIPVTAIYSEDDSVPFKRESVRGKIMEYLKSSPDHGQILLITQAALMTLPYFHRPDQWTLIVDEIPQVDAVWSYKIADTHNLITDHLQINDDLLSGATPTHYLVEPTSAGRRTLAEYRANEKGDQIIELFGGLADAVLSDHWKVSVLKEAWHRYMDFSKDTMVLNFFGLLEPSVFAAFRDVIIMGAMFDQSLLYQYWTAKGVEFKAHHQITQNARFHHHDGSNLTIRYILDEQWSKNARNKEIDIGGHKANSLSAIVEVVKDVYKDDPFVWVANRDVTDDHLFGFRNPRLPNVSHGLNSYQEYDHVIFLSALNRMPQHGEFLKSRGLDPDLVRNATQHQSAYQAVMRGSLRQPGNANPKSVLVVDRSTAEYLAGFFPGCQLAPVGGTARVVRGRIGRPTKESPLSSAERKAREQFKKKRDLLDQLVQLRQKMDDRDEKKVTETPTYKGLFVTFSEDDSRDLWKKHTVSLFSSIYSSTPRAKLVLTNDELIDNLRHCWELAVADKSSNWLLSSTDFNPDKSPETKRGNGNIEYVNGIWLDNDGGDLNWQQFAAMYPDLHMVAFNTFSGGNRYRIFIPTTTVMTVDVHRHIIGSIDNHLKSRGYYSKRELAKRQERGLSGMHHGFDTSKFTPCSLFYLPAQSKHGADDSFFEVLPGKTLDPFDWVSATPVTTLDVEPEILAFEPKHDRAKMRAALNAEKAEDLAMIQEAQREKAIDDWRATAKGEGNHEFFMLGAKLQRTGMDLHEIERVLHREAVLARSPGDRRKQIKSIIGTLRKTEFNRAA